MQAISVPFLVGAPHGYSFTQEDLVCTRPTPYGYQLSPRGRDPDLPVKIPGGSIYMGDIRPGQWRIAGHATDVAGESSFRSR